MKKLTLLLLTLLTFLTIVSCSKNYDIESNNIDQNNFEKYRLIAHAMGGVNQEYRYTNSKEGFIEHYNKGTRVFEVDLVETKEGSIVARHDWSNSLYDILEQENDYKDEKPLTLQEFKNKKINNILTPITLNDIVDLMAEYDDFYIVTDTKSSKKDDVKRMFTKLVDKLNKKDPNLLDRVIPQIYNEDMLFLLKDIYDFKNILYTLYLESSSYSEVIEFTKSYNISGVVMSEEKYNKYFVQKLNENGIKSYVHTINSKETIEKYIDEGVYGIYTDYIYEDDMSELLNK